MTKTSTTSIKNFFENAGNTISISNERRQLLGTIAENIAKEYQKEGTVNLNFICTHNSRRSQFGQAWAFFCCSIL